MVIFSNLVDKSGNSVDKAGNSVEVLFKFWKLLKNH